MKLTDFETQLEKTIAQARVLSDQPPFFLIKKVNLILQGKQLVSADGSISFAIPILKFGTDLGAKGTETTMATLKLELIPYERVAVGGAENVDLTTLIRTLKETFKPNTILGARSIEYSEKWALTLDANGKINAVVATAGAEISSDKSQEITFVLCQTLNRSDCI